MIDDHLPECPCDSTAHTCSNLTECRYCICDRLSACYVRAINDAIASVTADCANYFAACTRHRVEPLGAVESTYTLVGQALRALKGDS